MTRNLGLSIVAMTAVLACGAHAEVTAGATVSDFRVSLYDLDPTDGITPSITFPQGITTAQVDLPAGRACGSTGFVMFSPLSIECAYVGEGAASLSGDAYGDGATLNVSAVRDAKANLGLVFGAFILSPDTSVVISGTTSTRVSRSASDIDPDDIAKIFFQLEAPGQLSAYQDSVSTFRGGPLSGEHQGSFGISITNSTDSALDGSFSGSLNAVAVPVVPEPASVLLLMVGLAALVWRRGLGAWPARRRCCAHRACAR
jgi:hypothetical protein